MGYACQLRANVKHWTHSLELSVRFCESNNFPETP